MLPLFVDVDDCWQTFRRDYEQHLLEDATRKRRRETQLSVSEIMTLLITFQTSGLRDFKHFYLYLLTHRRRDFSWLDPLSRSTFPSFSSF